MEEYNKILTNDEEQKQYILQIMVKKYRSALPDKNKETIISLKENVKTIQVIGYDRPTGELQLKKKATRH